MHSTEHSMAEDDSESRQKGEEDPGRGRDECNMRPVLDAISILSRPMTVMNVKS